jgi:two-component system heavy metal sensor histidine kinase CusS
MPDRLFFALLTWEKNNSTSTILCKPINISTSFLKANKYGRGQFPIISQRGQLAGHLNVAISQVESALVLKNLRITLFFAFLFLVLIFYFGTSLAAARSIAPIQQLIQGARQINDQNISDRLPLPPHQDELFQLATTINELLTRIEHSLQREKQVTADISHELRSPLAGIRGTLEVLLRKKRTP